MILKIVLLNFSSTLSSNFSAKVLSENQTILSYLAEFINVLKKRQAKSEI